ncbi:MAG: tetratricopeptide repeat protein [Bacteroidota bacterium]
MVLRFPFIIFIFIFPVLLLSQVEQPDEELNDNIVGSDRVEVLTELFKRYRNSDPQKAIEFNREALSISEKIGYNDGIAKAYNNFGVYYKNLGAYDLALENYLKGLKLAQQLEDQKRIAFALSNIGTIYTVKGENEKALESFQEALTIFEELDNNNYLVRILNNIGNVYYDMSNYKEALNYYEQGLAVSGESGGLESFDILSNIGNIYYQQGDYEKAIDYYFQSLEAERVNKNMFGQAHALFNIGETYRLDEKYQMSLSFLEQSGYLARSIQDRPLLTKIYLSMAEVYFEQGEIIPAYGMLKKHMSVKDSLFNQESSKKLAELETAYELDKKEQEIQLKSLELRNQQLITFALIFIFFSLFTVAILVYLKYTQNQKAKRLLEAQNQEIVKSKSEVESQKKIIEARNQDITDSIEYAKGVQTAILNKNKIFGFLEDSFIFFRPKDIVSGDFYWYSRRGNYDIIAAVDCTGHGVAGAFMTIIGNSLLNQIINENGTLDTSDILKRLDEKVIETLEHREVAHNNHGMDVAICKIDRSNQMIQFAGAKRPLYIIGKDGEFEEIKGSHIAIADSDSGLSKSFDSHLISYKQGDSFFMCSDGFADQFGEETGKKFMTRKFKELLTEQSKKPMVEVEKVLDEEIKSWMGKEEQTDDILVIGFRL